MDYDELNGASAAELKKTQVKKRHKKAKKKPATRRVRK